MVVEELATRSCAGRLHSGGVASRTVRSCAGWGIHPGSPAGLPPVWLYEEKGCHVSQVEESIQVDVPVRTAYNQWTQFETFPQFMSGVERITQINDTLTHWKTKVGGVEREFDAEITEQIPDERVAWTTVGGEAKQAGVVTFHRLEENKTKVMLQLDYDPEGLAENVGDKLGVVKRQVTGDLKRFKEYIESRGAESGSWRGEV